MREKSVENVTMQLHLEASQAGVFPRLRLEHEPGAGGGGQSWETGQPLMQLSVLLLIDSGASKCACVPKEWSPSFPQPFC